ncbi:transposase [Rickettsiales endosymbiont of Peranema trichophorum]|uniref:Mu transposase C-terminal domain-containing protein n=1 Tax=Rickettsiales endosymbiont of Peranema trichophorum TaxID=2486577 RepID=UPI0010231446|nr:Mu transposase C-terminal domain-containing protein [Rickettsiales endosymbiont of Peranema trichophorum]RZI45290.1 transposase [Rickettsiales endosymbiont of Peranema trichophorum]
MSDISEINDKIWNIGKQRAEVIGPLAGSKVCTQEKVLEAAAKLGLSARYIYRLIRNYRDSDGLTSSLIPQRPSGGKGGSRLSTIQEALINKIIDRFYLTRQRLSASTIIEEVRKQCAAQNMVAPGASTIRRRIKDISVIRLQERYGRDQSIEPIAGEFPEVNYPLSVVQIDHTLVDVIIVDPIDRLPIGRPYVTIAIDVYSRCIAGFIVSLEAPSSVSVGLCLTHIAMDKGPWLAMVDIDTSWAIHGKPNLIHVDNSSEFHSAALTRGCSQHGIQIEYRPQGKVHYGGIIERVIGTMMKLVHTLPGTTFSNVGERGDYPSDAKACLTLGELERCLIIAITKYYHLRLHNGIDEVPIKRYERGLAMMKRDGQKLAVINNGKAFLIDFLPIIYRTLRRDGFMLDHIIYYNNALRSFIINREKYEKFLIRRDPRDLSRIYVYLPEGGGYLEVPYRTLSRPAISLFEHRLAIKRIKDIGKGQVQESALFRAIDEIRDIVNKASSKTRSMRRNRTRMQENARVQPKAKPSSTEENNERMVDEMGDEAFRNIEVWR